MDTIVMYTTSWCGDCGHAKQWLDQHNISYKEVNIEENQQALVFVEKVNRGMHSVPTIVFPDKSILVEPTNRELEEKVKIFTNL